jgi:hypothetical protein
MNLQENSCGSEITCKFTKLVDGGEDGPSSNLDLHEGTTGEAERESLRGDTAGREELLTVLRN